MKKQFFLSCAIVLSIVFFSVVPAFAADTTTSFSSNTQRAVSTELILDGSFEACNPTAGTCPNWDTYSLLYGSPICDAGWCGTGAGTAGPRTGTDWTWFGGAGTTGAETGYVEQLVTIPSGATATLTFYLWVGTWGGTPGDYFDVSVDSTSVFNLTGSQLNTAPYNTGYGLATVDISAYADGGSHAVRFTGRQNAAVNVNMNLDDISIVAVTPDVLVASAACNADNLDITITTGDGPYNITGTGTGLPLNGVAAGTYNLTGPASWTGVTVTETDGDLESIVFGDFNCPGSAPVSVVPGIGVPHLGEVLINVPQAAYQSPNGEAVSGLVLPADADGNGFDTYVVANIVYDGGEYWVGLFVGSSNWVWVPLDGVLPLSSLSLPTISDGTASGDASRN